VRVADPGRGLRRLSREEVDENWSGWCATFRPTPKLADAPVEHLDLHWLRPFVRPLRGKLALATVLAIAATGLELVAPVMTQHVVDAAGKGNSGRVSLLVAIIVALLFMGLGISLFQRRMLARAAVRLDGETLDFVSARLLQLPLKYFEARRTADIERRLNGLRQVRSLLVQGIVGGLTAVIQLAVTLFLMISYSPIIAAVFLGTTMSRHGEPRILATIVGVIVLGVLDNGLTQMSVDSYIRQVLVGALILIAVGVGSLGQKRF